MIRAMLAHDVLGPLAARRGEEGLLLLAALDQARRPRASALQHLAGRGPRNLYRASPRRARRAWAIRSSAACTRRSERRGSRSSRGYSLESEVALRHATLPSGRLTHYRGRSRREVALCAGRTSTGSRPGRRRGLTYPVARVGRFATVYPLITTRALARAVPRTPLPRTATSPRVADRASVRPADARDAKASSSRWTARRRRGSRPRRWRKSSTRCRRRSSTSRCGSPATTARHRAARSG